MQRLTVKSTLTQLRVMHHTMMDHIRVPTLLKTEFDRLIGRMKFTNFEYMKSVGRERLDFS